MKSSLSKQNCYMWQCVTDASLLLHIQRTLKREPSSTVRLLHNHHSYTWPLPARLDLHGVYEGHESRSRIQSLGRIPQRRRSVPLPNCAGYVFTNSGRLFSFALLWLPFLSVDSVGFGLTSIPSTCFEKSSKWRSSEWINTFFNSRAKLCLQGSSLNLP